MTDTIAVVMQIVRDAQSPESVASARTAWLVHQVLSSLGEKESKHDTLLQVPEQKFAGWASRVREGLRRQDRIEKK
jgi:hypothetical protein